VRNHLPRALFLAVVLLVLGTGLALARASLSISPTCIECCPLEGLGPCPGYTAFVTSRGWEPGERLSLILWGPGPAGPFGTGFFAADAEGRLKVQLIFFCENPWLDEEASAHFAENYWWLHPEWKPTDFGEWVMEVRTERVSVRDDFIFAEDCAAAEFVPEPGSLLLLGGGLAGLGGYSLVRWKSRRS
jgi:hypothetical protein